MTLSELVFGKSFGLPELDDSYATALTPGATTSVSALRSSSTLYVECPVLI